MCGIFGLIIKPNTTFSLSSLDGSLRKIASFSESRGKDSSGIAFRNTNNEIVDVLKGDIPINQLLISKEFSNTLSHNLNSYKEGNGFNVFGHARLVTNGSQLLEVNNQPVIKENIFTIHNGIITNVDNIWEQHPELDREYLIDTEIIPALLRNHLLKGLELPQALKMTFPLLGRSTRP